VVWLVDPDSIVEHKAELRRSARRHRNASTAEQRADWSSTICQHLRELVAPDSVVMIYAAIRSEVDLAAFAADRSAALTLLPRVEGERLVAVSIVGERVASAFGVPEPVGPAIDPATIDVVCLPGLAFDRDGRRLGYGAGFYDRFVPLLRPGALTIGVGFLIQMVDEVPVDDHDRLVDVVVTEKGVVGGSTARN
jgi:5-formyltetrahydrofolate cyclo-ligase